MNAKGHFSDFRYMLENAGAKICFLTPDLSTTIEKAISGSKHEISVLVAGSGELGELIDSADGSRLPTTPEDDNMPAWLFYTSGTTGRPKGAVLTHKNLMTMASSYFSGVEEIEPADHLIHAAPMSHGSGLYIVPHVARGASQVIPVSGKFQEEELVGLINHFGSSTFFAAPTMLKRLLDHPATDSLPGLKTVVLGGGPLYVHDCIRGLQRFGAKIAQIYGQGETPMTITAMTKQEMYRAYETDDMDYLGSVGRPFSTVEVAVVDADDTPLAPGETGEVVVRGDTVMKGYWNNDDATAETLRNGWLHTGDLGSFDQNRVLTLKDRSKDLIISGGTNIYPREVEEVLIQHPAVKEACVVGVPDDTWGEAVAAVLVCEPGMEIESGDIDDFCIRHLARFKRPKQYLVVDELPKNATGKVLKSRARDWLCRS